MSDFDSTTAPQPALPAPAVPAADEQPVATPHDRQQTPSGQARPAVIPTPTLGGSQFWCDVRLRSGWRIQRQVFTGSHRLLDDRQLQHASGTLDDCLAVLNSDVIRAKCPPTTGEVTILIHGILRGSNSMGRIGRQLEAAGLQPLRFDYPSTQSTIDEAASGLVDVVANLDAGVTRVNFVVHSMGGLVVRDYSRQVACGIQEGTIDAADHDRLGRCVMLGTPNHGAEMATHFKNFAPFQALFGPAGQQLAHTESKCNELPPPRMEFGIIAGIRGTPSGYNPFIPGDDDGTVTVASARLAGASDYIGIKGMHTFLMYQSNAVDAVERFLKTGSFRESGHREPILN